MGISTSENFGARLEELFQQASDLAPGERSQFLDTECAGDPPLRDALDRLLRASDKAEADNIWDSAIANEARLAAIEETRASGSRLDRYELRERIGAGGMGIVYKAVRADDSYSKVVAVKILQHDVSDEAAAARFRNERQILANLEHPNIARLLDGGETEDGQPFLVMEFVEGDRIDRYVKQHKLSVREILVLFRKLCSAISRAHTDLVVHRDLKPANVLVTAEGEPKLLDFGIAKLLDGTAQRTATGAAALTPEYASPEQLRGEQVTAASDIYSLGVLLYQLLSGELPYADTTNPVALAKSICDDPPRRLTQVDSEIENILQMSLRKEPSRRYTSVEQFSEDLRRYLEGYPIIARPDTQRYRARKFVRRNRLPIAAGVLIILTLIGGVLTTLRQARIANSRFNDVRNLANYFVADVHDAIKDLPGALPIRKIIVSKALEYLDSLSRDQGNDRELQSELANAYEEIAHVQGGQHNPSNLEDNAGALASYRKAAAIRERLVSAHPRDWKEAKGLAECYSSLGATQAQSMGNLQDGVATLRKAVALGQKAVSLNPKDAESENVLADAYLMLGDATGNSSYQNLGDTKGATELYKKALVIREKLANANPTDSAREMHLAMAENRLGMILNSQGDVAGALLALRRVLEIDEKALAADPRNPSLLINTASANRNLAVVLSRSGQRDAALPLAERAGALYQQQVQNDPNDVGARRSLAGNYYAIGSLMKDDAKAIPLFEASIAGYRQIQRERPGSAPEVGWRTALVYRAEAANRLENTALAIESAEQLKQIAEGLLKMSPDNFTARADRYRALSLLGEAHEIRGHKTHGSAELRQAESYFQQALDGYSALEKTAPLSRSEKAAMTRSTQALARLRTAP